MPHDRFFTNSPLEKGKVFSLEEEEFHHLVHVMRAKEGDGVECINGRGVLARATVKTLKKKLAELEVSDVFVRAKTTSPLILAQALPKASRLDTILEKGCELGMNELWLFPGERSEKQGLSASQQKRILSILINASKQCGQLWLPQTKLIAPLKEWQTWDYPVFYGDVRASAEPFHKKWYEKPPEKGVVFVVGPEGGLSSHEIEKLEAIGGTGVKLHPHILRTDTASLVALTLMSLFHETSFKNDFLTHA